MRDQKDQLRRSALRRVKSIPRPALERASEKIQNRILGLGCWSRAACVMAYAPLSGEVDTRIVVAASRQAGKRVAYPRVHGEGLVFHQPEQNDLRPGAFRVLEPAADAPVVDPLTEKGPLLVLVPGLLFDAECSRLGRGRGYYDRLLGRLRKARVDAVLLGVAFHWQVVEFVPREAWDVPVDAVVTEDTVYGCNELNGPRLHRSGDG